MLSIFLNLRTTKIYKLIGYLGEFWLYFNLFLKKRIEAVRSLTLKYINGKYVHLTENEAITFEAIKNKKFKSIKR